MKADQKSGRNTSEQIRTDTILWQLQEEGTNTYDKKQVTADLSVSADDI